MRIARAELTQMAVTTLDINFTVRIISPVETPSRIYTINFLDILTRSTPLKDNKQIAEELLAKIVLSDYNKLLEDYPIMDMFTDPDKYKSCTGIEWIFL